jgi:homoserine O-acetyltransferase/O-succinyltransferase
LDLAGFRMNACASRRSITLISARWLLDCIGRSRGFSLAILVLLLAVSGQAHAYDELVDKKVFKIASFTTVGGRVIKDVRFGYETYGHLDAGKDNVIVILPYFLGSGHAAGKYAVSDELAGYWDDIIGSGKPIDTDRYFVISGDGLINPTIKDGHTVTTGPASIDPQRGKPYGMRFPILTIRDLVNAQKALADSFKIKKLHAVMGVSMGGNQSLEWAAVFPESTERIIAVVSEAQAGAYAIEDMDVLSTCIKIDPNWNRGDYYGKAEPVAGLTAAVKVLLHQSQNYGAVSWAAGRKWTQPGGDPSRSWRNTYAAETVLDHFAQGFASILDANSFLYQAKASQSYIAGDGRTVDAGLERIRAKVLLLPARSDLLSFPEYSKAAALHLKRLGKDVEYHEIPGDVGHMAALENITQVGDVIRRFLSE